MEFAAFIALALYLLPWFVAVARDHEHHAIVLAATFAVGWTGIGWLAILAVALRSDARPTQTRARARRPKLELVHGAACVRTASHSRRLAPASPR